jgi:hypothetical protein
MDGTVGSANRRLGFGQSTSHAMSNFSTGFTVHVISQNDAPVQIISMTPHGGSGN